MVRRLITAFIVLLVAPAQAMDTSKEEQVCVDIGFKRKTEAFGSCVVEMVSRRAGGRTQPASNDNRAPVRQLTQTELDGVTCQKYGFKPNTANYSQCLFQINSARSEAQQRQAQYELQKRQYDAQLAAINREKERRKGEAMFELGMRMMGGQSPINAANSVGTGAPFGPPPVPMSSQTYTLPGNRTMTCSTMGNVTNCF
jgi:hypothetical protein